MDRHLFPAVPPLHHAGPELQQLMERFFNLNSDPSSVETSQWCPRVDIQEDASRFLIAADVPGVDPKDIEIHMDNGVLTVKGERTQQESQSGPGFLRNERFSGKFHRRFALPDSADPEGISAKGNNGVLEISIPKRPETQPRRIEVQ